MSSSRALIDLGAYRHNLQNLAARTGAELMPIIKADAYGHGARRMGQVALAAGIRRLGIAQVTEAVEVARGLTANPNVFSWIYSPQTDLSEALDFDFELSVGAPWAVAHVARAARRVGKQARVHLALDTGMAREGAGPEKWDELIAAVRAERNVEIVGIWSHLSSADDPTSTATARQVELFTDGLERVRRQGIEGVAHLAASAGLLWHPETHFDLVRPGISLYGLTPDGSDPSELGLIPVMRLEADLISVKQVPAGTPVSYGGTEVVGPTVLGVVPLGYADGIPRQASGQGAWVTVNGQRAKVVGRICMDQFVVDLGPSSDAAPGDTAVVFGAGAGIPTAAQWAQAAGSISYTMTTQLGPRVPREYV